jgi:hypothetical protein
MFTATDRPRQDAAASSSPSTLVGPAGISSKSRQASENCLFLFSVLRALLPAPKRQAPCFHLLPHSFKLLQNVTPIFPITSTLFVRSFAQERRSTPLFSCIPALFRENVGMAHASFMLPSASPRATTTLTNCSQPTEVTYSAPVRQSDRQSDRTEPQP